MKSVLLFHLAPIYLFLFQNILVNNDSVIYDKKNFQEGPSSAFTIKVIPAQEKTYGYEIYQGKKLVIRQENIPGLSGMKGFRRKSDAGKVARLVTEKLSKGIMPPTIEKAEMEKLKVQF